MELVLVSCYICGSERSKVWANENGYQMVKCLTCGLVYLNPRPTLRGIDEASRTGIHRSEKGNINTIGRYSRRKASEFSRKISELFPDAELGSRTCRWLDVGAGYGELIQAVRGLTAPGSEIVGIEPCEAKAKKAKALGLTITKGGISDLHGRYTHVSLVNVFSHLPDPVEFLAEIKSVMEHGCQLVLVTGNGGDIERQDFPGSLYLPDHLSFVGECHLKSILQKVGYHIRVLKAYKNALAYDNCLVGLMKNIGRLALKRPWVPLFVPESSPFRSLWVRAELDH